jgi:hypothetical protein
VEQIEVEKLLGELETILDRLRALYEQYFVGIERIEPGVVRKDVERRLYVLRKEQIRNTALRYRFQMVLQKYNTYQTHWLRICREIENGTYKRHLARAQRRFNSSRPPRRRSMAPPAVHPEPGAPLPKDLAAELADLDRDFAPDSFDVDVQLDDDAKPSSRPLAPRPSSSSSSSSRPPPRPSPRPPAGALPAPGALRPVAPPAAGPVRPGAPPAAGPVRPGAAPAAGPVRPGAPPAAGPVRPGAAPPVPPVWKKVGAQAAPAASATAAAAPAAFPPAAPAAPAAPRVTPPAAPTAPVATVPRAAPPPAPRAAPPAAAPPAPQPALRPPHAAAPSPLPPRPPPPRPSLPSLAPPRPAPDAPDLSEKRLRQIYVEYVDAKRRQNESTAAITYQSVAKSLRESGDKLREKHGKSVDFEVTVKDGKTVLRPVLKG